MSHHLYRVRKFHDLTGEIRDTRYFRNEKQAAKRAMKWRGAGWDVDCHFTSAPVTWSLLWFAGERWRND